MAEGDLGAAFEARVALWPRGLLGELEGLLERRGCTLHDVQDYCSPTCLPALAIPKWVGAIVEASPTLVQRAQLAAAFGYVAARAEDLLVDEEGVGRTAFVAGAARMEHLCLLYDVCQHPDVRAQIHSTWLTHDSASVVRAQASAAERIDRAGFLVALGRSKPLALPALVLLHAQGRSDLVPIVHELVDAFAFAAQLLDDSVDVGQDHEHQRMTWALSRMVNRASDGESWFAAYLGGGVDELFADVQSALDRVSALAKTLGSTGAEDYAIACQNEVESIRADVLRGLFGRLMGVEGV